MLRIYQGSDSAPHPVTAKTGVQKTAAGCFTQGCATQLVVGAIEEAAGKGWLQGDVNSETLDDFLSNRGRKFYKLPSRNTSQKIVLEKKGATIPSILKSTDGAIEVIPFRRGEETWKLTWKS